MTLFEAAVLPVGALVMNKSDSSRTLLIEEKEERVFTMRDNLGRIDFARLDEWPYWDNWVRIA
jgi:hypothetical protein